MTHNNNNRNKRRNAIDANKKKHKKKKARPPVSRRHTLLITYKKKKVRRVGLSSDGYRRKANKRTSPHAVRPVCSTVRSNPSVAMNLYKHVKMKWESVKTHKLCVCVCASCSVWRRIAAATIAQKQRTKIKNQKQKKKRRGLGTQWKIQKRNLNWLAIIHPQRYVWKESRADRYNYIYIWRSRKIKNSEQLALGESLVLKYTRSTCFKWSRENLEGTHSWELQAQLQKDRSIGERKENEKKKHMESERGKNEQEKKKWALLI